jgi:methionyl-tRNA formyltransferase
VEVDRVYDPFSQENRVYLCMTEDELKALRFDIAVSLAYMHELEGKILDAMNEFLYYTDDV